MINMNWFNIIKIDLGAFDDSAYNAIAEELSTEAVKVIPTKDGKYKAKVMIAGKEIITSTEEKDEIHSKIQSLDRLIKFYKRFYEEYRSIITKIEVRDRGWQPIVRYRFDDLASNPYVKLFQMDGKPRLRFYDKDGGPVLSIMVSNEGDWDKIVGQMFKWRQENVV